jgi:hypothetical protein
MPTRIDVIHSFGDAGNAWSLIQSETESQRINFSP